MRSIGKTLQRVNDHRVSPGTFRPNREQVFHPLGDRRSLEGLFLNLRDISHAILD
jgi:hypothetical protein